VTGAGIGCDGAETELLLVSFFSKQKMEKVFTSFFPHEAYSPLDALANRGCTRAALVRYRRVQNMYQYSCTLIRPGVSVKNTGGGELMYSCIIVPYGQKVAVLSPLSAAKMTLTGPLRIVMRGNAMRDATIEHAGRAIDSASQHDRILADLQMRMCVRMYTEPCFAGGYADVPVGFVVQYRRLLEFQSMMVPYGFKVTPVNGIHSSNSDGAGTAAAAGEIRGPIAIPFIHHDHMFYGPMVDPGEANVVRDHASDESGDIPVFQNAYNFLRCNLRVTLDAEYAVNLQPLVSYYVIAKLLGTAVSMYLEAMLPYKVTDDTAQRVALYWLKKFHGDYSVVVPLLANERFAKAVRKAVRVGGGLAGPPAGGAPGAAAAASARPW
jgi:hypothetical protein